jgi:hypothetical protein
MLPSCHPLFTKKKEMFQKSAKGKAAGVNGIHLAGRDGAAFRHGSFTLLAGPG